ncbi:hypothetical protein LZ554_007195 [Drepanopeziza brunnea f. sp. 'monogermtubi']|nr:hypothetical protein LZ554_007195 [Drepanopeziza brunnea f. sp. 'monogermtubi']
MSTSRRPSEITPLLGDGDNSKVTKANTDTGSSATTEQISIPPQELSPRRLYITLASVYVGVFLGALDGTIIATLSAPISTSFNSLSLLSWLASAYLIANAACQPLSGRLTDIFSRRRGLVVSNILFAAGNLICGLATSQWTMIAGRAVSGVGGGGLMAISTFVASDLVPLRKRGIVQGLGNVCFGTGAGLGGVFGGWVTDLWGWRVAFLAQVPLVLVSGFLVWWVVDVPVKESDSDESKLSRVDFLGSSTLLLTLVLLLLGLNSGGNVFPWTHPLVLACFPLSGVALLAFIYVELYIASEPVIPIRLLLNRTVAAACLCNWFTTMVTFMVLFYMPIFFQVKGVSTTGAGLRMIPQSVGASFGSLGSGLIMNRTGKYKVLSVGLLVSFCLGTGLLSTLSLYAPDRLCYIYLFLIGTGYGGMLTCTLLAVIAAVDHEYQAVITSATYAFRSTGSSIGVTIASAVFQNLLVSCLNKRFAGQPGAEEEIQRIRDSFDELNNLPPGWEEGVRDSFAIALKGVFVTAFGLAILGAVCTLFIKQHILHNNLARRDSAPQ